MPLLSQIHTATLKKHEEVEAKPFLKRYQSPSQLTPQDHFNHLVQLLAIYEAIELKVRKADKQLHLSEKFSYLFHRSEKIKSDIHFLLGLNVIENKNQIASAATLKYVNYINQLDPEADINAIVAHFLVRILGDLHGGQKLKGYVSAMYAKHGIASTKGLSFYTFESKTLMKFNQQWLNNLPEVVNEEELIQHANQAFDDHLPIFDALEEAHVTKQGLRCSSRLFSSITANTCLAAATLAVAALSVARMTQ
jgi:heme oxygenase